MIEALGYKLHGLTLAEWDETDMEAWYRYAYLVGEYNRGRSFAGQHRANLKAQTA